jgi:uncharacterized LabA/DUF88 family protein
MDRVAVFVDAGYLFAQGSAALTGSQKPRSSLLLDAQMAMDALKSVASNRAQHCRLLRIYWYDGAIGGGRPTSEQALIAHLDDVKLRLGFINSSGQQKGVDSLIVTDLIELARQKSVCDAVLLSGDEDVRIGVQVAQSYGVRVHLLGITPSRGSQSHHLLQEADTTTEWEVECVRQFLSVRPIEAVAGVPEATTRHSDTLEGIVADVVGALQESDLDAISVFWETNRGVPPDIDRKLLGRGRGAIARELDKEELKLVRARFQKLVKERLSAR